ncbi:DUF418 domain-containing protein [Paenibacillus methanolicus]|uniref:Putative membrane protein YeiB n=1 Tax=Paenibacillus methanolicus TaxID=582686 RepID=A0A5S5C6V0_9BACL|nr:DUF418 domain-containing protein [Paenibacillus methanolicus]TYP74060.1 putative membrane protein YeiB [Paenibacillus methanolicus]
MANAKRHLSRSASNSPISPERRLLAPDLGRGFMLLLIVIAHVPMYIHSSGTVVISRPLGENVLDDVVNFIGLLLVDNRSYPLFAGLFGYGLAFMVSRQLAAGVPEKEVRRSLRRRSRLLIAFGFVHFVFIGGADILGLYGVTGLLFGRLLFRPKQALLKTIGWVSLAYLIIVPITWVWVMPISAGDSFITSHSPTYAQMVADHAIAFPFVIAVQMTLFPMVLPVLLGIWLSGKPWIERPEEYRRQLKKIAFGGIGISAAGALPLALAGARLWDPPPAALDWSVALSLLSGIAGGFGYLALIALLSLSAPQTVPRLTYVLAAIGKRSLTFYLYQEALLVLLLSPVAFGIGAAIGSAEAFLIAVLIWLSGGCLAAWLERHDRSGPADALMRKLVYRK